MSILIDRDLISRAVNMYSDTILRIAFHHTQNSADAEDVTQEVFLSLLSVRELVDETHLKAWLIRVAINKCKDLLKSHRRKNTVSLEYAATKYSLTPQDLGVMDIVRGLPPLDRDIVFLHYFEGYSAAEVGFLLGKKEGAIYTRLKRIRVKLKDLLDKEEL